MCVSYLMKYTQFSMYWKYQIIFKFKFEIVIILKKCIASLLDLTDMSDLIIVKNSIKLDWISHCTNIFLKLPSQMFQFHMRTALQHFQIASSHCNIRPLAVILSLYILTFLCRQTKFRNLFPRYCKSTKSDIHDK